MALYEERISSRGFTVFLALIAIPMVWGLMATYQAGQGFPIMLASTFLLLIILLDAAVMKIEIDEREVRIRGLLGLIVRKTVEIENIERFSIREGWMSCSGTTHFTLPAKGCILIRQKKGWTVSFSTNHPEEIAQTLAMRGVPREP
ncbi:hypothetical protein A3L11_01295 [Thermococcus siculi]|uniref:DUF304 domain-containing protein n=1 Tax=Thermococcus siculi TaxID=72803 RepID=A0A2Z2MKJ9_9EURY|nr:hypothetical protein [Thermococcus siculi]ASJ07931.1 hypothetical protein A3L11_01295 [Thermococcus siculi]